MKSKAIEVVPPPTQPATPSTTATPSTITPTPAVNIMDMGSAVTPLGGWKTAAPFEGTEYVDKDITSMRRTIAKRLTESKVWENQNLNM